VVVVLRIELNWFCKATAAARRVEVVGGLLLLDGGNGLADNMGRRIEEECGRWGRRRIKGGLSTKTTTTQREKGGVALSNSQLQ